MRQEHRAGDKFFVDYSGSTLPIVEAATGKIRGTQILVKVIGNCNLPFAEAQMQVERADKAAALAAAERTRTTEAKERIEELKQELSGIKIALEEERKGRVEAEKQLAGKKAEPEKAGKQK
jgi:hypothetical protein